MLHYHRGRMYQSDFSFTYEYCNRSINPTYC